VIPIRDNIPTDRFPLITIALIVANVLAYFLWQRGGLSLGDPSSTHYLHNLADYGAIPYELTHPSRHCDIVGGTQFACEGMPGVIGHASHQPPTWLTPFTAMFMHGGLIHLGGNMLFLWIFGNNVEDVMGRVRYVAFYVLGGLAAVALQVAMGPNEAAPTIGASGAIAAVLGGYLLLWPRARVFTVIFIIFFFTIVELPAIVVLGGWFLLQVYSAGQGSAGSGGVAYFAHIGGFVFGLALIRLFARRAKRTPPRLPAW
jgi:membrane associated rhomboid family serine protease